MNSNNPWREAGLRKTVHNEIVGLIRDRVDLVTIAARHRSKFEGWLQYELIAALQDQRGIDDVVPEYPYGKRSRCDIACTRDSKTWLIELKVCNTNWRAEGVVNKIRPITKNIAGVVTDIKKLRQGWSQNTRLMAFLFAPLPLRIWKNVPSKLDDQLSRIEKECQLSHGVLRETGEYVPLAAQFGVAVFVVNV